MNKPDISCIPFSREQLFNILKTAPVGMTISRIDGSLEYANPALLKMLGYSEIEIYHPQLIISHRDDLKKNKIIRQQLLDKPYQAVHAEKRYIKKDGQAILCLVSISALTDNKGKAIQFVAQIIDIEYRKQMEKSANLFRSMINVSKDSMFLIDPQNGNIIDSNVQGCQSLGYTYEEILTLSISDVTTATTTSKKWEEHLNDLKQTGSLLIDSTHRHKNGTTFPVEVSINYIIQKKPGYILAIARDITERKKNEALIWQQANYDNLTGLPNRNMLYQRLREAIKVASRTSKKIAVFCLDLDKFKDINDTLGHAVGDQLLVEAGQRIRACLRETDIVSRFGGDEFFIIMENIKDSLNINHIATDILSALSEPFIISENKAFISTSIGITLFPDDATSVDSLLKNSDQAMYFAKNRGRNCFQYFTKSMQTLAVERMHLSRDLHDALHHNEFYLEFQPIFSLADGRITKAEALLRWRHPHRKNISPEDFIKIAEENGTIHRIGEVVFSQAIHQVKIWRELYDPDFQISINASPLQFKEGYEDIKYWQQQLAHAELPGDAIIIEITEGLIMDTDKNIIDKLLILHDANIQIALDDFGTGYSSLAYLQKLDIDYLKIDRSFIENLTAGSNEEALCEAIVVMAHRLNLQVVAEGIETQEQHRLLLQSGCDYGQGFIFSKSLVQEEFKQLLIRQNRE